MQVIIILKENSNEFVCHANTVGNTIDELFYPINDKYSRRNCHKYNGIFLAEQLIFG